MLLNHRTADQYLCDAEEKELPHLAADRNKDQDLSRSLERYFILFFQKNEH